jgi:hypothetical protein
MKSVISKLIAVLLLVVPGLLATYGFLAMKDAIFAQFDSGLGFLWGKFVIGFICFAAGTAFIGGWTFYRDRKRNYVAPRFKAKRKRNG